MRTLTWLDRAFRTSDNFTINEVRGHPGYFVSGLEVLRREGSVTLHAVAWPGATLRITWL